MKRVIRVAFVSFAISIGAIGCGSENSMNANQQPDDSELRSIAVAYFDSIVNYELNSTTLAKRDFKVAALAPSLTYHQIQGVISTLHKSVESISETQAATISDHGGTISVLIFERGTSKNRIVYCDGSRMNEGSSQIYYDKSGSVYAYMRYFSIASKNYCQVSTSSTNMMQPWNLFKDGVYVK